MTKNKHILLLSAVFIVASNPFPASAQQRSGAVVIYGTQPLPMPKRDASQARVPVAERLKQCWQAPLDNRHLPPVMIEVSFSQEGYLIKAQLPPASQGLYRKDARFREATNRAFNAIKRCTPLKPLPNLSYNMWQKVTVVFGP